MNRMKHLWWAMVLALTFSGVAQADEPQGRHESGHEKMGCGDGGHERGGHGHGMGGHHNRAGHFLHHLIKHQKELGLTDEQVAKVKTVSLDFDRARIRTEANILVAERELASLVHDEKADMAAIESKIKESETFEVGLRVAAIKAKREAWSLLTPDQREKVKAEREKRMRHHQE
ncbi:MAG: Spy/CpxP family protein refolding chaperone [Nitrospiraceae bacterium]